VKEQILTLEPSDDPHSVRDKIARAQAGRLLLAWPSLESPPLRRIDLALIRRWAAMAGAEIAVVSPDRNARRLAKLAGLDGYPNLTSAALASLKTRPPTRKKPPQLRPRAAPPPARHPSPPLHIGIRILIFFTALAMPLLALGMGIPAAVIRVSFPTRTVAHSFIVDADSCAILRSGIALTERRSATGRLRVPVSYAVGSAVIANVSDQGLNLPAGLQFSTPEGISFTTTRGLILPAGKTQSIPVRAAEPGPDGNIPAGSLSRVDGPPALSLTVTNRTPFSGGDSEWRTVVIQTDLDALREELSARMDSESDARMRALAGATMLLVEDSVGWEEQSGGGPEYPAGTPVETVGWTLQAEASALACSKAEFLGRAKSGLAGSLRADETLQEDSIQLDAQALTSGDILISAVGRTAAIPSKWDLTAAIRLQTPDAAAVILAERYHAAAPLKIDLYPDWFPLLPPYPFRMELLAEAE
jgi:hypothetical protein